MTRNTPSHIGSSPISRYLGPALAGLAALLAFAWASAPEAKASPVTDSRAAIGSLFGSAGSAAESSAGATISARRKSVPKRKFIARADRICKAQVPRFKRIEAQVIEIDRRIKEAEAAGDLEALLTEIRRFAAVTGSIAPPLVKRRKAINKIKVVRRARPKAYNRTLGALITSIRGLSNSIRMFADNPTTETQQALDNANNRMLNTSNRHFKAAKNYGFRECSKPLSVN